MAKRRFGRLQVVIGGLLLAAALGALLFQRAIQPTAPGMPLYVRYDQPTPLATVLTDLESRGVVRSARAMALYARLRRRAEPVRVGTYEVRGGLLPDPLLAALRKPVRQMVRLPETNWSSRSANILQKKGVTKAADYNAAVKDPARFKGAVSFPLPKGSLEGYLYPDTYDLPPLLGAEGVIRRQLQNFEKRVWKGLAEPKNLHAVLTKASLVELEVAKDDERPIVAGVIENRLRLGMRLQIDAAVLFAMQKWQRLTFKQIREADSPYNTYLHAGLPPGPICSPSVKSIRAALKPAKHAYLYYVALPDGHHLFSATYEEHLANIARRKKALAGMP